MVLSGSQYKSIMQMAKKCCAKNDRKPALQGIMVNINEGKAKLTVCDGYRAMQVAIHTEDENAKYTMPIIGISCKSGDEINIIHDAGFVYITNMDTGVEYKVPAIKGEHVDVNELINNAAASEGTNIHINSRMAADAFDGLEKLLKEMHTHVAIKLHVPANKLTPIHLSGKTLGMECESIVLPIRMYDEGA